MPDYPPCDDVCGSLEEHVRRCFTGHPIEAFTFPYGPILEVNPHFRVLRVEPASSGGVWTYVTTGGWAATEDTQHGLEFVLCSPKAEVKAVELLAMTVFYHRSGGLGLGHTLPIGEPWLPGSACTALLLSTPYVFDPTRQTCHIGDRHVDFLWVLPITEAERAFKVKQGLEALESRFEDVGLNIGKQTEPARSDTR